MFARSESIAKLAQIDELRHLRFADDELRPILDFLLHVRIPEREGVPRIILPTG